MKPTAAGLSPAWLALREPADATARSTDLVDEVRRVLPADGPTVVHDLGCGTGSMGRWLAPLLPGPQHWISYDREPELMERAAADGPVAAADGASVTVSTRQRDLTRLDPGELAGASLVTASALLDMLTADEVARVVASCLAADCPALITLSVVGRVELSPPDPLDSAVAAAFDAHQRRSVAGRRLLGPDAAQQAVGLFTAAGSEVLTRPSPWRLGPESAALAAEWFTGWVAAACEQEPGLTEVTRCYVQQRRAALAAGALRITVHHLDVLAGPR